MVLRRFLDLIQFYSGNGTRGSRFAAFEHFNVQMDQSGAVRDVPEDNARQYQRNPTDEQVHRACGARGEQIAADRFGDGGVSGHDGGVDS